MCKRIWQQSPWEYYVKAFWRIEKLHETHEIDSRSENEICNEEVKLQDLDNIVNRLNNTAAADWWLSNYHLKQRNTY